MHSRILSLLAALACALVAPELSADPAGDEAWKKVEAAMKRISEPEKPPQSREEAIAFLTKELANFDAAAKEFSTAAPKDARQWDVKYFDAEISRARELIGQTPPDTVKTLDEILAAPDASAELKGNASGLKLGLQTMTMEDTPGAEETWKKDAEAHLAKYPDGKFNEMIAEKLKAVAAAAELKTKPLEIKFTAVDGREVDLSKMRGKVILIDFWATWCGPCVAEIPNVLKTYEALHPKGFEIVGVSLDSDKAKLEAFVKEKGMSWPQYFDGKGWQNELSSKYGINSIPAMWLVDKKGMLVSMDARHDLQKLVEKHLAAE